MDHAPPPLTRTSERAHGRGRFPAQPATALGLLYKKGSYGVKNIEILALYWHFVDLVWMFVVPLVYLMNMKR